MISKTVYSLIYPETKKTLEDLWLSKPHDLYKNPHKQKQLEMDKEFLSTWIDWTKDQVNIPPLPYFYPTAGSSEAIRETIAFEKSKNPNMKIHIFKGEYEGYKAYAQAYNIPVVEHERDSYKNSLEFNQALKSNDLFFLSQPSSIDGNYWSEFDSFASILDKSSLSLMLDLCYIGCTTNLPKIDLTRHSSIKVIFFSLSKVFGVYYHRIGGVISSYEMPSLYGNQWFKNLFSLQLGINLMKNFKLGELPNKYKYLQEKICLKHNLNPCDVILLGQKDSQDVNHPLYRHKKIRGCLSPIMERILK